MKVKGTHYNLLIDCIFLLLLWLLLLLLQITILLLVQYAMVIMSDTVHCSPAYMNRSEMRILCAILISNEIQLDCTANESMHFILIVAFLYMTCSIICNFLLSFADHAFHFYSLCRFANTCTWILNAMNAASPFYLRSKLFFWSDINENMLAAQCLQYKLMIIIWY